MLRASSRNFAETAIRGRGARKRRHQSVARAQTASSAPGSSKRWVAPGTISSRTSARIPVTARRFRSTTWTSWPPTTRRVGARTRPSASPARSGRPPREMTARTASGRSAAAISAAAAPVLAPNNATAPGAVGCARTQSIAARTRRPSIATSKRCSPVCSSASASGGVRRSSSNVPKPAASSVAATNRLRRLKRLLPLPWANTTSPAAMAGTRRSASSSMPVPAGMRTARSMAGTVTTVLQLNAASARRCRPRTTPCARRRACTARLGWHLAESYRRRAQIAGRRQGGPRRPLARQSRPRPARRSADLATSLPGRTCK